METMLLLVFSCCLLSLAGSWPLAFFFMVTSLSGPGLLSRRIGPRFMINIPPRGAQNTMASTEMVTICSPQLMT